METEYVNVLDLNGLKAVVETDFNRASSRLSSLSYPEGPGNYMYSELGDGETTSRFRRYNNWLDDNLEGKDGGERRVFAGKILEIIGDCCREGKSYNPTWVAPWEQFEPYVGEPGDESRADRWQQVMGLAKEASRWLVLVKYTYADLGRVLYRPTQLDAGAFGWHFPSHPQRRVVRGGQAMELAKQSNTYPIVEYIHQQVDYLNVNHVLAVAKTTRASNGQLRNWRLCHRSRLRDVNPSADNPRWYPRSQI